MEQYIQKLQKIKEISDRINFLFIEEAKNILRENEEINIKDLILNSYQNILNGGVFVDDK